MKYAFLMHLTWQVIEADEQILDEEVEYFAMLFPDKLQKVLQLEDEKERFDLYEKGVEKLPKLLSYDEKMDILDVLVGASVSDGFMEFREFGIIEAASKVLDIPQDEFMSRFDYFFLKRQVL